MRPLWSTGVFWRTGARAWRFWDHHTWTSVSVQREPSWLAAALPEVTKTRLDVGFQPAGEAADTRGRMLGSFPLRFVVHRPRILAVCTLLLLGLASPAMAQPVAKDAKLEAKAHFMSGQSHYNLNEFPEALADFKDAYRLYPDPVFLYNVGQCERQLGHFEEAIRFYRNFLREQPKAPNRQDVTHKIEEMEAAIKNRASVPTAPPPADVMKTEPSSAVVTPPITTPPTAPPPDAGPAVPPPIPAEPSVSNGILPADTAPVATALDLSGKPPEPAPVAAPSFYQRWWFWAAVSVVAIGAGVGIYAVTAGKGNDAPTTDLGTRKAF